MIGSVADDADTAGVPLVYATSGVTVILGGDTTTERYLLDDANLFGDDRALEETADTVTLDARSN